MYVLKGKATKKIDLLVLLSLLIGIFAFAYRKIFSLGMLTFSDFGPFPSTPEAFERFLSAWEDIGLGRAGSQSPFWFFSGLLTFLFSNNVVLSQKMFLLSLMPASAITMYVLLSHIIRTRAGRLLFSITYSVNPFTIDQFLGGGGGPSILVIYALLPVTILFLLLFLEEESNRIRNFFMLNLVMGFATSLNVMFPLYFSPFIAILALANVKGKSLRYALTIFLLMTTFAFLFLFTLPYFIAPLSEGLSPLGAYYSVGKSEESLNRFLEFLGNLRSPHAMKNLWNLTWITGFLAVCSLFVRDGMRKKCVLSFLLIGVSILLFWFLTVEGKTSSVYLLFPPLLTFRDFPKLMLAPIVAYYLVASVLLDEVEGKLRQSKFFYREATKKSKFQDKQRHLRTVLYTFISLALFILAFTYNIYPYPYRATSKFITGIDFSSAEVPNVVYEIREWLDARRQQEGYFRTLWLPQNGMLGLSKILTVYDPHTLHPIFGRDIIVENVLEDVCRGNAMLGKELGLLNIKYVVVNLEDVGEGPPRVVRHYSGPYYAIGDPKEFIKVLNEQKDLRLIVNRTDFLIYENKAFTPHVSAYQRVYVVAPREITLKPNITIHRYSGNLIVNGDFEHGTRGWNTLKWSIDNKTVHSGRHSIRAEWSKVNDWNYGFQDLNIKENTTYYISAWMKTQNVNASHIKVEIYDREGKVIRTRYPQTGVIGTRDWWKVEYVFLSPPGSVKARLLFMGGWSLDGINPGITYFDDVEFVEVFAPPADLVRSPTTYAEVWERISSIPLFSDEAQLLMLGEWLSATAIERYLNLSQAVIFLGDVVSDGTWVNTSATQLFIYEGELYLTPKSGYWRIIQGASLSYGHAAECLGEGEVEKVFFAPRNGYYRTAILGATDGKIFIRIDDEMLNLKAIAGGKEHFRWLETNSIYLERGYHRAYVDVIGNSTILDQLVVLSAHDEKFSLENSSPSTQPKIKTYKISPTEYRVSVDSGKPIMLVLGESFHPEWKAYVNGKELEHIPSSIFGWANGFYINNVKGDMKIVFERQKLKDIAVAIWAVTWISLLAGTFYTSRAELTHKILRLKNYQHMVFRS